MNVVVHMTKCAPGSTVASARVARFIVETLGRDSPFTLVDDRDGAHCVAKAHTIDTLFIVNGPMAFCDFLPQLSLLVRMASRVVFVQQDYTIMPPKPESKAESPFRKVFADLQLRPIFWTTVRKNVQTSKDQYINWNQLTYDPQEFKPMPADQHLLYYGAYREKREPLFKKYLANAPYDVHVSTTNLRGKKFKALDENILIIPPFSHIANIPMASASIYIEDPLSSKEFHSPANRFYEMLSAGIPLFFEASTLGMLAQASIFPRDSWVTYNSLDLYKRMEILDLDTMRREQRELWDADYVDNLEMNVLNAWHDLNR